jgi:formate dehydrogenase maturation protein FdhE
MMTAQEVYDKALKVVTAIREKHGVDNDFIPATDIEDTMPCPVCGNGVMTYTISKYNGHRSAECSTQCFGHYVE